MIVQGQTISFKQECYLGYHVFGAGGVRVADSFMVALYTSDASLDSTTTVYTSTGETTGPGYVAGGQLLTVVGPLASDTTAYVNFANVTWTGPLTARGALIYNATQGNRAVVVLDFGGDKTQTNFTITFPLSTATSALIRMT